MKERQRRGRRIMLMRWGYGKAMVGHRSDGVVGKWRVDGRELNEEEEGIV